MSPKPRPIILFRSTKGSMRLMSTTSQKTHNAKMRPRLLRLPTIQQSDKATKVDKAVATDAVDKASGPANMADDLTNDNNNVSEANKPMI
jgi:hypothetical protein